MARILGHREFWGLPLHSRRNAGAAARYRNIGRAGAGAAARKRAAVHPLRIADIGTGSGAILFALLSEWPDAQGIGTDISPALRYKQHTTMPFHLRLSGRAKFVASDYAAGAVGRVRSDRVEPALYPLGGYRWSCHRGPRPRPASRRWTAAPTGLTPIARWFRRPPRCFAPGGALVVEAGHGQSGDIEGLMMAAGLTLRAAAQSRSGGYPAGGRGPENAPIKPDWNAKKPLGIFARERLRSGHNIGPGFAGPVDTRRMRFGSVSCGWRPEFSEREPAPSERFQNAGPIERDG